MLRRVREYEVRCAGRCKQFKSFDDAQAYAKSMSLQHKTFAEISLNGDVVSACKPKSWFGVRPMVDWYVSGYRACDDY